MDGWSISYFIWACFGHTVYNWGKFSVWGITKLYAHGRFLDPLVHNIYTLIYKVIDRYIIAIGYVNVNRAWATTQHMVDAIRLTCQRRCLSNVFQVTIIVLFENSYYLLLPVTFHCLVILYINNATQWLLMRSAKSITILSKRFGNFADTETNNDTTKTWMNGWLYFYCNPFFLPKRCFRLCPVSFDWHSGVRLHRRNPLHIHLQQGGCWWHTMADTGIRCQRWKC